ncbi:hypothetical protein [Streptosporangium sp. NPDC006930]|uniref:hypothetical protein n=1 Tax=Streptosporangium sp. NPDC006930 TaxID=3154783 RepID=UPI003430E53F
MDDYQAVRELLPVQPLSPEVEQAGRERLNAAFATKRARRPLRAAWWSALGLGLAGAAAATPVVTSAAPPSPPATRGVIAAQDGKRFLLAAATSVASMSDDGAWWGSTLVSGEEFRSPGGGYTLRQTRLEESWIPADPEATTKARIALYRDGALVGEEPSTWGEFTVPAGAADYRLVTESERGAPATLSTRTSTAWTFRSEHVGGESPLPLPISVIGFSPALDAHNSAPGGRTYSVPVTVRQQAGSGAGKPRDLAVEVSYDDGATWSRTKVHNGAVTLRHPAAGGFASLRATSTDTAGNTVEQTVIRAYRIAPAKRP